MTQESTVTPSPSPLSASLLAQRLPFSGGGFSSSCASLASLNARLFLPAFARHRAAFPHPTKPPAAADSEAGRRAGEARPEGEKCRSGRRKAHFHPGGSCFSLPRGTHAANFSALQFHPISFYAANRFFVSFLTQERNVPLVSSLPVPKAAPSSKAGGGRCYIAFYSCISAKHARQFTACAVPCAPRGTASARTGRSGRGHRGQRRGFARPRRRLSRSPCWRGPGRAGDRSADAAGSRR